MQKHAGPGQEGPGPACDQPARENVKRSEVLILARGRVGRKCEFAHDLKELRCLTDEEAVGDQTIEGRHGCALGRARTNDGHRRELPIQEDRWLRHDEVSLEFVRLSRRVSGIVEIGKGDKCA